MTLCSSYVFLTLFGHNLIEVSLFVTHMYFPRILLVEILAFSDSKYSMTYIFKNNYYGLAVLSVIDLKSYLITSSIVADQLPYWLSPPIIILLKNLISIPNAVSRSLPRIISYILLVDLSTWNFHVTIFVALNSSRKQLSSPSLRLWTSYLGFPKTFLLLLI